MAFLYENSFFFSFPETIQPALLSKAFTTKEKANNQKKPGGRESTFLNALDFSPGNFNTHEWSSSNNATGATLLESKRS